MSFDFLVFHFFPLSLHIIVCKECIWYIDILEIIWGPACGYLPPEKVFPLGQLTAGLGKPVLTQSNLEPAWFIVGLHSCMSCSAHHSPGMQPVWVQNHSSEYPSLSLCLLCGPIRLSKFLPGFSVFQLLFMEFTCCH